MSHKKRAIEKQKKQQSPKKKAKQSKKAQYNSWESREKWKEKKARKHQSQITKRVSKGISVDCPLQGWEQPSVEKCSDCTLKCSFKNQ